MVGAEVVEEVREGDVEAPGLARELVEAVPEVYSTDASTRRKAALKLVRQFRDVFPGS